MMDAREFVRMVKKEGVDDLVSSMVSNLNSPKLGAEGKEGESQLDVAMADFLASEARVLRKRSEFFRSLTQQQQELLVELLKDCAENSAASVLSLIDGVAGPFEGVFELVAISGGNRTVVNPQNSEMLHDLFAEACSR